MLYVLVKVKGTGTTNDPFRAGFPTYRLVASNPANTQAIIEVPDADVLADYPTTPAPGWAPPEVARVLRLQADREANWNELIRKRYKDGHSQWQAKDELE